MHGRPRKPTTAEDPAASAANSTKLKHLQSQLLHNHHSKMYSKEAVLDSGKLLEINPEVYTAWNYRKLAFQRNLNGVEDAEIVKSLIDNELRTVEMALRRNPKSYGAWHHRKWVLNLGLAAVDFDREFRLLDQLLKVDPRNFHGWNYRRFIAKLKSILEVEELEFTMDMINTNFSNYSAWHNRSALLSKLLKQKGEGFDVKETVLTEEYELVRQALFTDPSDQSGWFYHLWLLDQTVTLDDPQLISSWPSCGSDWVLSSDKNGFILSPSSSSNFNYSLQKGTLPIILYFNQVVTGVNSSTVTVNSVFPNNEDIIWTPLTTSNSREAHCWVACLNISDAKFITSDSSTVEISISHLRGIMSSSGFQYSHPLQLMFTISIKSSYKEQTEASVEKLVTWNDDQKEIYLENANEVSFGKPSIIEEHEPQVPKWNLETLSNEIDIFRELSEENCKFAKLTLARLLIAQDVMASCQNLLIQKKNHFEEVLELFDDLVKLDPSHAGYYEDERSMVIMNQVTFDRESIMKYFFHSGELTPCHLRQAGLRLSRLSLSRIGCVERLLWVQRLDLSGNELRSIAGLEAFQLLVCLNLSNNRINSFTTLEPLKLLKSLKILNISSNEIGYHPVDTYRYLCASLLSHTNEVEHIIEEFKNDDINVGDYWEAMLLFKELNLAQLDLAGNPVAVESLRTLLPKVLPTLKWLDGACVR